jgi:ribonuclease HIII
MSFTNEDLDKIIKRFEAEIADENKRNIRQCYQNLKTQILDDGLVEIGCLNLLTHAYKLMGKFEGDDHTEVYKLLSDYLVVIDDAHNKIFNVLYENNYEILFYDVLSHWEVIKEPLEIDFSEHEGEFIEARKEENYYVLLKRFFVIFLSILEEKLESDKFQKLKNIIEVSLEGYKFCEKWDVLGMFTLSSGARLYGIKIIANPGEGNVKVINSAENNITSSAQRAVASVQNIIPSTKAYDFTIELEREDIKYSGRSIELAFCAAIAKKVKGIAIDPYTAFTGSIDIEDGKVERVTDISKKLHAASMNGIKRVFIPEENRDDIGDTFPDMEIRPVSNISEVFQTLDDRMILGINRNKSDLFNAKIKKLIIFLKEDEVHYIRSKDKSISGGLQLWFTNYANEINVNLYSKSLKWVIGGSSSPLKKKAENICRQVFGDTGSEKSNERKSITLKVSDEKKRTQVQNYFSKLENVIMEEEKNCIYRAKVTKDGSVVFVRQFSTGTLLIDGSQNLFVEVLTKIQNILGVSDDAIAKASAPDPKKQAQIEAVRSVDLGSQWIGTDESGKGDYYGPLVGAAVLIDKETANILEELGIKDSKKISDKRIHDLAIKTKEVCGEKAQVITISPEKYNKLYHQFNKEGKNLNTLLAWAHTRGIENIIERYEVKEITVIVDKFADESYIQSKMLEGGRKADLNIVQLPKAEANIAVAAASVLARSEFLKRLAMLSKKYKLTLPKGASDPKIVEIGKDIVQNLGEDDLRKIAKIHFKTTKKILKF